LDIPSKLESSTRWKLRPGDLSDKRLGEF